MKAEFDRDRGITLIEMMIVVMLIAIIAAIIVPRLTESRMSANETSAISSLKAIATAQAQYRETDAEEDQVQDFAATMMELSNSGLVDNVIGSGTKSGYTFALSGATFDWQATATPASVSMGKRAFFIDLSGVVRYSTSGVPDANSPPVAQ